MIMMAADNCGMCGARGKRPCPALNGPICPACCGAGRGSRIECPADCEYYPFGTRNYDGWLRVDGSWFPKAQEYVEGKYGPSQLQGWAERLRPDYAADPNARDAGFRNAVHYLLFRHRDGDRTAAETWEAEGWTGLDNDERVMMKYRRDTLPTIVEIERVLDDHAVRCRDLLDAGRGAFVVFDRGTAGMALPYSRLLVALVHYPHFSRFDGVGIEVREDLHDAFLRALHKRANSKGDPVAVKRWLVGHFREGHAMLSELARERWDKMIESVDFHHCRAYYRFKVPRAAVRQAVLGKPDFALDPRSEPPDDLPDAEHFVWRRLGEAAAFRAPTKDGGLSLDAHYDGVPTLANLWLAEDQLVLEAFSKAKFEFALKLAKRYFGSVLAFDRQTVQDMKDTVRRRAGRGGRSGFETGSDADDDSWAPAPSGVPPEVERAAAATIFRQYYSKLMDDPIPALSDHTPREAARDPALRSRLIDLMKGHIRSVARLNREKGTDISLDPVLRELGLHELLEGDERT